MEHADTRTRIQQVAIRLFNENGYEATSLREIADEIGVTKAALYYHFKTKDEIVTSLIDDRARVMDELIAWSKTLPPTLEGRRTFVERYAAETFSAGAPEVMRFFERNPTALRDHPSGERMRGKMLALADWLTVNGSQADRVRRTLGLLSLHAAWFILSDQAMTDEQRRATALEVALDLIR